MLWVSSECVGVVVSSNLSLHPELFKVSVIWWVKSLVLVVQNLGIKAWIIALMLPMKRKPAKYMERRQCVK